MSERFRAGVGAVVCDGQGRVLVFERLDHSEAWQLPQGGIEQDEDPRSALWRELFEEAGITQADVELLHEVPEWLGYELPPQSRLAKTGRGQVHKWFVLRARDPEALHVRLDAHHTPEFRRARWVEVADVVANVVPFRRPVYVRLQSVLSELG